MLVQKSEDLIHILLAHEVLHMMSRTLQGNKGHIAGTNGVPQPVSEALTLGDGANIVGSTVLNKEGNRLCRYIARRIVECHQIWDALDWCAIHLHTIFLFIAEQGRRDAKTLEITVHVNLIQSRKQYHSSLDTAALPTGANR